MFITFEGLDFCGKSTQVKLLKDYLLKNNHRIELIREPGGTKISEKIRDILLDKNNHEMFDETELLLFSASRSQLVREFIIPRLKEGYYVISDRFHDSSTAYQGYGRGLGADFVAKLNDIVIGEALPDITFLIDIPVEEVFKRKKLIKNDQLDRIEVSERNFYENVRNGYLNLANNNKRFKLIDGTKSIDEIHQIIINDLKRLEANEVGNVE
ncbi:MAG: dTMP kinase [Melioribacteraceae bacterium]|nr:dTMP kinase [Melioribacteraceae bacterium]MCF8355272.1 dTMP kinase [Melioribacteraceae bacterium]MCF8394171.1 dTMP kinase [Melioribacteraceae bacterium]MCF8418854.1 dTMP kinase [Melioribacteraceae bacterium]